MQIGWSCADRGDRIRPRGHRSAQRGGKNATAWHHSLQGLETSPADKASDGGTGPSDAAIAQGGLRLQEWPGPHGLLCKSTSRLEASDCLEGASVLFDNLR